MEERLAFSQIAERYPDQWVGLDEIEWDPDNSSTVKSAVVRFTDKSADELTEMQIKTGGKIMAIYTTPDNVFQLGMVGVL